MLRMKPNLLDKFMSNLTKPFLNITTTKISDELCALPINEKAILIWDVENIGISQYEYIQKCLKYNPIKAFAVTKREPSKKELDFFEKNYITYKSSYIDADTTIIQILKLLQLNVTHITIISADSDFCHIIKKLLAQDKYVNIITDLERSKRIIMKLPLTHKRLRIDVYEPISKNKKTKTKQQIR